MAKHTRAVHGEEYPQCENEMRCNVCNLFICAVCKAAEGTLTTDCPGRPVDIYDQDLVYDGTLDFRAGVWYRRVYRDNEAPESIKEFLVDTAVQRLGR